MPNPAKLTELLETPRIEQRTSDPIAGYAKYSDMKVGSTYCLAYRL
ncbi:MAG: hypothetical protein ACOC1F_11635 [Myxococcota bacterium]